MDAMKCPLLLSDALLDPSTSAYKHDASQNERSASQEARLYLFIQQPSPQ